MVVPSTEAENIREVNLGFNIRLNFGLCELDEPSVMCKCRDRSGIRKLNGSRRYDFGTHQSIDDN